MGVDRINNDNRQIRRVTYLGAAVNLVLSVIKVVVGSIAGSMSLVADGIHSISDLATDVAVLVGTYYGSKEPDLEHQYGHGRIETFSAMFVAAVLAIVGLAMGYRAIMVIADIKVHQQEDHTIGWIV
ncbi:MAG: cation diffusion facilitator family transporter, partial [Anaerohalosphaera sp.]|nr:cation diffusion facilitator family transporter [Anaerohalosphaera sp.]